MIRVAGVLIFALVVILVGAAVGVLALRTLHLGVTLTAQPGWIRLPEKLRITAEATQPLDLVLDGIVAARVPFRQRLEVPFRGKYKADVSFKTRVPVEFTVEYNGVIPVDTMAEIEADASINFQNVKQYRDIHMKAQVPLKMDLPVKLVVPVKQEIDLAYDGPIVMEIDQPIEIPVDTAIDTSFRIDERVSTKVVAKFPLEMAFPEVETPIVINHADLKIALSSLRLGVTKDPSRPVREQRVPPGEGGKR